jgi:FkbM family methyltransferase
VSVGRRLHDIARRAGIRVSRWRPANRFDAMRDALELLRGQGFASRAIIDVGANVGDWSRTAHAVFPDAHVMMIEPQPACQAQLRAAAAVIGRAVVHPIAASAPGRARVGLIGGTATGGTGVGVVEPEDGVVPEMDCDAVTLDSLLADRVTRADRPLLKLDVETHEIPVLEGARRLLEVVEVVIAEAQVYPINENGRPVFGDLVVYMGRARFELYDLAAMSGRGRDRRLRMVDAVFVRADSPLARDRGWE